MARRQAVGAQAVDHGRAGGGQPTFQRLADDGFHVCGLRHLHEGQVGFAHTAFAVGDDDAVGRTVHMAGQGQAQGQRVVVWRVGLAQAQHHGGRARGGQASRCERHRNMRAGQPHLRNRGVRAFASTRQQGCDRRARSGVEVRAQQATLGRGSVHLQQLSCRRVDGHQALAIHVHRGHCVGGHLVQQPIAHLVVSGAPIAAFKRLLGVEKTLLYGGHAAQVAPHGQHRAVRAKAQGGVGHRQFVT